MTHCLRACSISLIASGAVGLPAAAQNQAVIPAIHATQDAPSLRSLAGFCANERQQFLIGPSHLAALAGRSLVGFAVRRDSHYDRALGSAQAQLSVSLSDRAGDPDRPSPQFAANRGATPRQVFSGSVAAPASPALGSGATAPWDAAHSIRIAFAQPFPYAGGTLCVEIDGYPVVGTTECFWPIDAAAASTPGGAVQHLGAACGPFAASGLTASAVPETLRLGNTAVLIAWGLPSTPAVALIGSGPLSPPLDLGPMGATGCTLQVNPSLSLPLQFGSAPPLVNSGAANLRVQVPTSPTLAGGSLFAQWLNIETSLPRTQWSNPAGITASNGLQATLSSAVTASLDMAMITSAAMPSGAPLPSTGETVLHKAPVVELLWQ